MTRLYITVILLMVLTSCNLVSEDLNSITIIDPQLEDVIYGTWEIREVVTPEQANWQELEAPYETFTFHTDGRFVHEANDMIIDARPFAVENQDSSLLLGVPDGERWSVTSFALDHLTLEMFTDTATVFKKKLYRQ